VVPFAVRGPAAIWAEFKFSRHCPANSMTSSEFDVSIFRATCGVSIPDVVDMEGSRMMKEEHEEIRVSTDCSIPKQSVCAREVSSAPTFVDYSDKNFSSQMIGNARHRLAMPGSSESVKIMES